MPRTASAALAAPPLPFLLFFLYVRLGSLPLFASSSCEHTTSAAEGIRTTAAHRKYEESSRSTAHGYDSAAAHHERQTDLQFLLLFLQQHIVAVHMVPHTRLESNGRRPEQT